MTEARDKVARQQHDDTPFTHGRHPVEQAPAAQPEGTGAVVPEELLYLMVSDGQTYFEYAVLQLDDADTAEEVVDDVFADLAAHWDVVLRQESVPRFCWAVLKATVDAALTERGRGNALATTAAFIRTLREARGEFETLTDSIGLYRAIAQLPDRQYDAVVLTYVLDCDVRRAAQIMGITEAGVHSLRRDGRRRLAAALGPAFLDTSDTEER